MSDNHKFWAGCVRFFLSHTPPGVSVSNESDVYIAHVHWYNHPPERKAMSLALGSYIHMDDNRGNMWPLEKLASCPLAAVYHKTCKDCIRILSKFANFLKTVPS